MADVARLAGVSVSTVSYALNGTRPISAETRARIEAAMAELRYTPNAFARGLRGRQSKIIALALPTQDRVIGVSMLGYLLGASDHAQEVGYHLLLWTTEAESLPALRALVHQGLVDGVLLMDVRMEDPRLKVLADAEIPFAMIGHTGAETDVDWVDTDFDQCVHVAVEHLAGLGHRDLVFVNQALPVVASRLGLAVRAEAAVERAANAFDVRITVARCESAAPAGHRLINAVLDAEPRVTAALALNEQAVPGLITGAQARGLRVPDDLSIVSVAMSEQAALMLAPPMTTVNAQERAMGRLGVQLLINRLEGAESEPHQQLFAGELHVRGTSGVAPGTSARP